MGALQTHSAPSRSPRRVLFLSATGTGGGAVISALLRAAQLPRYTGAFWGRASRVSPGLRGLGEVLVVPACSGLCYHRHPRHTLTWRLGPGRLPRLPLTVPLCPPGSGKNDSAEKVAEKLEALSVQEGEQPQDVAPAAAEEEQ